MSTKNLLFPNPIAFWFGCMAISFGVLSHIPMFIKASHMGYKMVGMSMDTTMLMGMLFIPLGFILAGYGLMSRYPNIQKNYGSHIHFVPEDESSLDRQHWKLILVLFIAVAVDVMKPATLGFVMPGMMAEYNISSQVAGRLALVALTGTAIGSILWGMLADTLGRRAAILLSALMFIGTSICGAMPSFSWNLVMCFLMGMSAGGLLPITFTLMAECIPSAHRGWLLVALSGVGTAAGYLLAAGSAAWLEPLFSWRILWMLGLPTGLVVIFLNRYIPESPRFLADKGGNRNIRQTVKPFNNAPNQKSNQIQPEVGRRDSGSIADLFKPPYFAITVGLLLAGVAWGLVNFGFLLWLPTSLHSMGYAEEANLLLTKSAFFSVPGVLIVIWLYYKWSSIYSLSLFLGLSSLSMLIFSLLSWSGLNSLSIIVMMTALLLICSSGVIAMLIPYAAEIYPVNLRGTGAGLVAASSKLGGILGSALGVSGLFQYLSFSAILIAIPLCGSLLLLIRNGIETRGLRLGDVYQKLLEKDKQK